MSYKARPDENPSNSLPFESRNFAHEIILYPNSFITISSGTNVFSRLPPPYDTMCRNYRQSSFQSRDHCLNDCFHNHVLMTRGHVSFDQWLILENQTEIGTKRRFSFGNDMKNVYEIESMCRTITCRHVGCQETYISTRFIREYVGKHHFHFVITYLECS